MTITLTINGIERSLTCAPHESLMAVLRREGFYSVRFGSDTGETGAAAVLVDGRLISSDIMLAAQADGHEVETVEGLAPRMSLHPIQEAFVATGAIQSGYSTPAMILAAKELLGHHDFTTFRAVGCQARSPEKTLDQLDVVRMGEMIVVTARARSFLHHQVRNMVGTLTLVGDGKWGASEIVDALAARDRKAGGPTAPADGLYLVGVGY